MYSGAWVCCASASFRSCSAFALSFSRRAARFAAFSFFALAASRAAFCASLSRAGRLMPSFAQRICIMRSLSTT